MLTAVNPPTQARLRGLFSLMPYKGIVYGALIMALGIRFCGIRPFVNAIYREDGRYLSFQTGLMSFNGVEGSADETYDISYVELGRRCDHLTPTDSDAQPRKVSAPLGEDHLYLGDKLAASVQTDVKRAEEKKALRLKLQTELDALDADTEVEPTESAT